MDVKAPNPPQQMYLQSADGGVWKLTVNNTGNLVTEKVGSLPVPSPF